MTDGRDYREEVVRYVMAKDLVGLAKLALELAGNVENPKPKRRKSDDGRSCYVYYAVCGDEVKIGVSYNPWSRVHEMKTARPNIRLCAIEKGDSDLEDERHRQFADAHLSREWFRLTPEIMAVIEANVVAPRAATNAPVDATSQEPPSPLPSLSSPRPLLNSSFPPSPASSSTSTAEDVAASVENSRTIGEPDAETALAQRLENDADRAALTAILAAAPFRPGWIAELTARLDGMHGDPLTPRQVGEILRDYVGNGHHLRPNFKHFRAYLSRPDRPSADAAVFASANGRTKTGPPASDAVKILGKIRGLIQTSDTVNNGIRRFIPRKDVEALEGEYPGTIAAYDAIGGVDAVLGCEPAKLSFLTRDFAAALQAARGG